MASCVRAEASGECVGNNVVFLLEPSAMGGVKRPVGLLCPIKYSNWQGPLEGAYGEAMVGEFGGAAWARGFQRVPLEPVVCDCCWGASCDCVNRGFTGAGYGRRAGQVDEVVNGDSTGESIRDAGTSGRRGGKARDRG